MNYADRVQETTTATSTTTVTLAGAVVGYRAAAAAFAVGTTGIPFGVSDAAGNWEIASYTLTNATTLTREAILASSNSNAAVTFPAGSKNVFCTATADLLQRGLVNPDDVGFDIIIGGPSQSNFCSRGVYDSLADVINPRVFQFGGANTVYSGNTIDAAHYRTIFNGANPVHNEEGVNTGNNSMLAVMASAYIASQPSNRMALIVPVAHGGTTLVAANFNGFVNAPWAVGGILHENMIAQAAAALAAAQVIYPSSRIVAFGSLIGESDQTLSTTQAAFVTAYKAVIADARTRLSAPNAVFVICGMAPEYFAPAQGRGHQIDDAHRQIAAETSKCIFVPGVSGYVQGDVTHYTGAGVRIMGAKAGLAVRAAQFATGVDTTAPTFVSAQVSNSDPTKILVTMSEPLANVLPVNSAWTPWAGKTVIAQSISGLVNTLTINSPLTYADGDGTIQYTKPGSGNMLQDMAATPNLTASFGPSLVKNNITAPASALTGGLSASTVVVGNPVTITVGTDHPLTGAQSESVALSSNLAGSFGTSPLTLNASTPTAATTFTPSATGTATITVTATGTPIISAASATLTVSAAATAPATMAAPVATAGVTSASVALTAPSNGGSPITGYTVVSSPAGGVDANAGTTALTHSMTGLTAGTAYTFTATATNAIGTSPPSPASNSVTPTAASLSLNAYGTTIAATATPGVYQGQSNSGFWGSEGAGTLSIGFQNGVDGEFVAQMLDVPKHVADATGRGIGIGLDTVTAAAATDHSYIGCDYFLMHRSDACKAYTNGSDAGTDSGGGAVVAAQNDYVRVKRTGSAGAANTATLTLDVSHNAGGSWTTIKTFTGAPTTALYVRVGTIWTSSIKLVSASGLA